jgi:hypothetical protein
VNRSSGLVLGGLLVALVAGAVLLAPPSNDAGPNFRIAGRGPYGLSGIAAGLRAAGMHVQERDKPTLGRGLSVIVDPHGVTSDEASSWMRSVRNGATLLYAPGAPDPFTRELGLSFTAGGDASPAAGAAAFPDVNVQFTDLNLQLSSRAAMRLPQGATNVYATDAGNSVAAVIAVGRGSVWVFADPVWFTNLAAVQVGLPVLLPLAQSAGGTVSVDGYHQSPAGRLDVLPYMPSWAPLVVLEGLLAGALLLASLARRNGPVRPTGVAEPNYLGDLAPSLAGLYERAGELGAVTGPLANAIGRERGARRARVAEPLARLRGASDVRTAVQAWHDANEEA